MSSGAASGRSSNFPPFGAQQRRGVVFAYGEKWGDLNTPLASAESERLEPTGYGDLAEPAAGFSPKKHPKAPIGCFGVFVTVETGSVCAYST